tara:strand:+ start:15297 stop:16934 length:1638 start_codon:yes stop_codon:yes gene_type:complete
MAAIVTDQFRINNASNFLGDVNDTSNSYYVFVGLSNPGISNAFGRAVDDSTWNTSTPNPTDDFNYLNHSKDTMIFGKKITPDNIRRVIRKVTWTSGNRYEIYRHDYNSSNASPITDSSRLYDANYFVINKDYNVYICIDNGSSGINTEGNRSQNEPLFTGLEPTRAAGSVDDGYIWKFLFSVAPSDIIKFDATEFIPLPNDWNSSTDAQITAVRDNGNADVNNNQIKNVYIADQGNGYAGSGVSQEFNIVGDGSGGKVIVDVVGSKITGTQISVGGKGYTYGMVDLTSISSGVDSDNKAKLIPIIPPSKGHGYDLYKELGADRVLVYARFDDSTKDFPIDTKFAQIGIVKNPTSIGSTQVFTDNQFSSVKSLNLNSFDTTQNLSIGAKIQQSIKDGDTEVGKAFGYVVSYDIISEDDTNKVAILKYYQDRSLYFNPTTGDQTDYTDANNITERGNSSGTIYDFQSTSESVEAVIGSWNAKINTSFSGITTNPSSNKIVELGVEFTNGIAASEINNESGDIIYLDNRALITRDSRQKEDIKVILEF